MKSILKNRVYVFLVAIMLLCGNIINAQTVKTVGTGANYSNLKAAFDAINSGAITGTIELQITTNVTETATATLYQNGYTGSGGTSDYSSVKIYPTVSGLSISGNLSAPLISFNGANNVTIDGQVNASGSTKDLIIINSSNGYPTIKFYNDAYSNEIRYCTIKGANGNISASIYSDAGVILIGAANSIGNKDITIDNCNLTSVNNTTRPRVMISSFGTSGKVNDNITISNCNFYDFFNTYTYSSGAVDSEAIVAYQYNTNGNINVINNSFYETTSFVSTGTLGKYLIMKLQSTKSIIVRGNYIGGSEPKCKGLPWTKTGNNNGFVAIQANPNNANSVIENNKINNINWTNTGNATWEAINCYSNITNIIQNNTIGSTTGNDSIVLNSGATGASFTGINSSGPCQISNNIIGAIKTTNNPLYATNIYCLKRDAGGQAQYTNNIIGSTTTANSINAASTSTDNEQRVIGIDIYDSGGSSIGNINNNIIANLTNGTTSSNPSVAGYIIGINKRSNAPADINNNEIYNLNIANANNLTTSFGSVVGICVNYADNHTIRNNKIYNLYNSFPEYTGQISGIYVSTGINQVYSNFIHNLSATGSNATANIYGIKAAGSTTTSTYSNNVINIGNSTSNTFTGFYDAGIASQHCNFYHNTIYLGGTPATGSANSYALYSNGSSNTRNYRNNILFNARSNNGATGKHYAAFYKYATASGLTNNYNNYYTTGTDGIMANFNSMDITTISVLRTEMGQDKFSLLANPGLEIPGGTTDTNYKPTNDVLFGVTGTSITTDKAGTPRVTIPTIGAYEIALDDNVEIWKSGAYQHAYKTLKSAFDDINIGLHSGALVAKILGSTTETTSAVLYQSGYTGAGATSSYSSLNIYPTVSGLSISGNLAAPLIDLNGADNVTMDGRVNINVSVKDLVIINYNNSTTPGTSTIRFINDATLNTVKYCQLKGAGIYPTSGIVFFSSTTGNAGNINNLIENNNISGVSSTERPLNAIFSYGTTAYPNSGLTINNNNIFDFLNKGSDASYGVYLSTNNTASTITNNSFYETSTFIPGGSAPYSVITLNNFGTGYQISNNFIGGSSSNCGGTAWTKTNEQNNSFSGISINIAITGTCEIQGNNIRNLNWSNASGGSFEGIFFYTGIGNIGTTTGNIIGSTETNGSISFNSGNYGGSLSGILTSSSGSINCQNNTIAGLTTNNSGTYATHLFGINYNIISSLNSSIISNNVIGSSSLTNSLNASSASTGANQYVYGIINNGSGQLSVTGNTILNLTNATTSTGGIYGIYSKDIIPTTKPLTITGNVIHDLYSSDNNSNTDYLASGGIVLNNTGSVANVSGNKIYNITNNNESFAGQISGIYFSGNSIANSVNKNMIYNLYATGASSTKASIYGIKSASSGVTYAGNIINLGGTTATNLYGIFDAGLINQNCNVYFNSIYLGGTVISGTNKSYCLHSNAADNTRNYRNNILYNARSTTGGSNLHYAAYYKYDNATNLTNNYNDYYVSGTGGTLAYYNSADISTLAALQTAIGQDAKSKAVNPLFAAAGGTNAIDYIPSYTRLKGVGGTGITTDYAGVTRYITQPAMGAYEYGVENLYKQLSVKVYLQGLWNPTNNNMNTCKVVGGVTPKFAGTVVDTVFLELHDPTTYATIVHRVYGLELQQNGTINSPGLSYINIPETYSDSYYVTIRTRNHLQTTSAAGVSFSPDAPVYDFTTAATQAYGSNMKQLATGIYGFYAGDVTQDGLIDPLTDFATVKSAINSYAAGYHVCDLNGDGLIDPLTDFATVKAQINAYIKAILP